MIYFNDLSTNGGGIFDEASIDNNPTFTALPVNFDGLASPGDSNLFFVDFQFLTPLPPQDNILPTGQIVSITTNSTDVVVSGTAVDNVSVSGVHASVLPRNGFNGDLAIGPKAKVDGTNWFLDCGLLAPGNYNAVVNVQDGEGNISPTINMPFVMPGFPLHVAVVGTGIVTPPNIDGKVLRYPSNVVLKAVARGGSVFAGWTMGTNTVALSPSFTFSNINGGTLTATFVQNDLPNGITFTFPPANGKLTNGAFTMTGKLSPAATNAHVTARIFSRDNNAVSTGALTFSGSNAWSVLVTNQNQLAPGHYTAQAVVTDQLGRAKLLRENFDVLGALVLKTNGPGTVTPMPPFLEIGIRLQVTAKPKPGQSFYFWTDGSSQVSLPTVTLPA